MISNNLSCHDGEADAAVNRRLLHVRGDFSAGDARSGLLRQAVRSALASLALIAASAPVAVHAAESANSIARKTYAIPSGPLADVLAQFAAIASVPLSFDPRPLAAIRSPGLQGSYSVREGFERLLKGTGYELVDRGGAYTLRSVPVSSNAVSGAAVAGAVNETALTEVKVQAAPEGRFGDAPPERGGFNAEYQTTATKTPLSIRETPQAISVATRESMEARQSRDLASALELSAGAAAATFSSGGPFTGLSRNDREEIALRGQRLDNLRDIRIDGFSFASQYISTDMALFERVEVIKGPSSSLYGPGSLSGFINRVTKKPQAESKASLVTQLGSYDTYRVEGDVTGSLDADKRVAGRLVVAYEDTGSFIDSVDRQQYLLAPSLSANLGGGTRVLAQAYFQNTQGLPSPGMPLRVLPSGELVAPNILRSTYTGKPGNSHVDNDQYQISARVDHELNDRWLATLMLQKGRVKNDSQLDNYAYGMNAAGDTYLYTSRFTRRSDVWTGELRLDGRFDWLGRKHQALFGLETRSLKNGSTNAYSYLGSGNIYAGNFEPTFAPNIPTLPLREQNLRGQGMFGQFVFSLTDRTRLLAGLRHETTEQDTGGPSTDKSATTWRIGLSQDLTANLTAFAAYATSFSPVLDVSAANTILDPETGKGYEVGLKGEWLDRRLGATLSAFRQKRENVPLRQTMAQCLAGGAGLTVCSASAGRQQYDGIEFEMLGRIRPNITLGLATAWNDGEFIEPTDPNFGRETPNTIERQTSLYAEYRFTDGSLDGVGIGATLVSLGKRNTGAVGQFVDGYERVDLNFSYTALPGWNLSLQVRNLFDKTYLERVFDPGQGNYFGSPRAFLFRAAYQFK